MGYTRYKTLIMNYLQIFFTNKWHKGHHRITPNSGRAIILSLVIIVIFIVIDWFSTIKLQKYNEITNFLQTFLIPSSGYRKLFFQVKKKVEFVILLFFKFFTGIFGFFLLNISYRSFYPKSLENFSFILSENSRYVAIIMSEAIYFLQQLIAIHNTLLSKIFNDLGLFTKG